MEVLKGMRAISMGSAWAGPYVGRVLSELGAEVIRIAFGGGPLPTPPPEVVETWLESLVKKGMSREDAEKANSYMPGYIPQYQTNNLGFGLDLRTDRGKEIYRELVKHIDIIVDGWSPRVMANLGLDYTALQKIRPDIIYVSIPALGMTGPDRNVRMWGSGCGALSGMTSLRGYQDGSLYPSSAYMADPISAMHILTAVLAALNFRLQTGNGQHIDVSQTEVATAVLGEAIMDYSMNKRVAKPMGNRHPYYSPHGCYRCRGNDAWVTIAVTSDEEWQNLCQVLGHPDWLDNPKFSDTMTRWQHQDELDKLIEEWTIQHDHYAIQQILQKAGVPSGAVVTVEEQITTDPQIKDRDMYHWLPFSDGVSDPIFRCPWLLPKTPPKLYRGAPFTGQHNEYILHDILGMSKVEIDKLTEDGVIATSPPRMN